MKVSNIFTLKMSRADCHKQMFNRDPRLSDDAVYRELQTLSTSFDQAGEGAQGVVQLVEKIMNMVQDTKENVINHD